MNRSKLINVLIAKSLLDVLLVGTVAVGFYMKAFPPYFHGWGEATNDSIAGWAVNNSAPWDRVQVQLFIDGQFAETATANLSRPDVAAAGWARDEWHGYNFRLSNLSQGSHEARVYVLHESGRAQRYTLQLLGDPVKFSVDGEGLFHDFSKPEKAR